MQRITKALAALMLMTATMFVAGCTEKPEQPEEEIIHLTEGEWIDLGLPSGLLWASCNVGATAPEEYGDYFAWGETEPKSVCVGTNYRYYNDENQLTKYCYDSAYGYNGFTDTLTVLEPNDDAATVNMGEGARTPTPSECQELLDHTTSKWVIYKGMKGRVFIGGNGNSIFLPAAGMRNLDENIYPTGIICGCYWTNSLCTALNTPASWYYTTLMAVWFYIDSAYYGSGAASRPIGSSVRAVRSAR